MSASCPLCGDTRSRAGWPGRTEYAGRLFNFRECVGCRSQFCDPMPDTDVLTQMYGSAYAAAFADDPSDEGESKQPELTLAWLQRLGTGTFVDFGCGDGSLLVRARDLGWRAIGVELNAGVAASVRARTGLDVHTDLAPLGERTVDVLHLGDVLEHLTSLDHDLPRMLRILRPGGHLVAQGPLEANASLFTWAIRAGRALRPNQTRHTPPYHVMLATARGQRSLFARNALIEVEFAIREVSWPAPSDIRDAWRMGTRGLALYSLRRASRAVAGIASNALGNRYFYVGVRSA